MDAAIFTLRIEGIAPDDLPTRRLAAYIEEFARLLGEEASTRFEGISEGSTKLAVRPLPMAVPKVRARLAAARDGALDDARRLVNRLDDMLCEDNASGTLSEDGRPGVILRFPGANARIARLPVIAEAGSIQGELVRIGGRDETAHASLRDHGVVRSCTVSRDLARALGKYLFGPPLRLLGRGRWKRAPDGTWELEDFRASDFEVLDNASLTAAAEKLKAAGGFGHTDASEAWGALKELRSE
jgi:hypothetical protein